MNRKELEQKPLYELKVIAKQYGLERTSKISSKNKHECIEKILVKFQSENQVVKGELDDTQSSKADNIKPTKTRNQRISKLIKVLTAIAAIITISKCGYNLTKQKSNTATHQFYSEGDLNIIIDTKNANLDTVFFQAIDSLDRKLNKYRKAELKVTPLIIPYEELVSIDSNKVNIKPDIKIIGNYQNSDSLLITYEMNYEKENSFETPLEGEIILNRNQIDELLRIITLPNELNNLISLAYTIKKFDSDKTRIDYNKLLNTSCCPFTSGGETFRNYDSYLFQYYSSPTGNFNVFDKTDKVIEDEEKIFVVSKSDYNVGIGNLEMTIFKDSNKAIIKYIPIYKKIDSVQIVWNSKYLSKRIHYRGGLQQSYNQFDNLKKRIKIGKIDTVKVPDTIRNFQIHHPTLPIMNYDIIESDSIIEYIETKPQHQLLEIKDSTLVNNTEL